MKKVISLSFVLLILVSFLTACNFTQNLAGALADDAESTKKAEELLLAMAEARDSDVKALLHPTVAETSDDAIAQMAEYLAGRKATDTEVINVSINTSTGTSGKMRQESITYKITLEDSTEFYVSSVYLSDGDGSGFISFQLVLGLV
ncbi:MAG: hypothetical protein E7647_01740 [Ruminococcaceae bacterium]|nr:hypothetical protein [Oscillospiraceae bacterium]